ncbi:MAG: hypothetical protein ACREJM_09120 [Candidatus Saccharimonadales bacterium]
MTQGPASSETYPAYEEELPETELDLVRGIGEAAAGQESLSGYDGTVIEDSAEPDEPEDRDDEEATTETGEVSDAAMMLIRRRAADRAGRTLKCYVKKPDSKDPEHGGRSHADRRKQKKSGKRDDDRHKGGGGGEWWRRKVREAKATHGETCRCTLCMSPIL